MTRHLLGIRFGWWKDRVCARRGHVPSPTMGVGIRLAGRERESWYPICERCGKAAR